MYLIGSVPPINCLLRKEFLFNLEAHHGDFVACTWIGVTSFQGRAIGFRVVTEEGVQFNNLPIHAFCSRPVEQVPLDVCELWDCFSYNFGVHEFRWLKHKKVRVLLKDKSLRWGTYLFTITWGAGDASDGNFGFSEASDAKDAHIIELDSGIFVAQPNNRLIWHDMDSVTKPLDLTKRPGFKVLEHRFVAEAAPKWRTEDSSAYFYDVLPDEKSESKGNGTAAR